jgi:hypothetical protein
MTHINPTQRERDNEPDIVLFRPHPVRDPGLLAPRTTGHPNSLPLTVDAVATPSAPVNTPANTPARTPWRRLRPWLTALALLITTAATLALTWLVYVAVLAVITVVVTIVAWIHTHLLLIAVIGIALLFFGGSTASCAGLHCGGCRR